MTTTPVRPDSRPAAPQPRGPIAPRFVFPVIDRIVHAQPNRVIGLDTQTDTIHRLRVERPPGYHFRAGQHALLRLTTGAGPDLRPLSLAGPPEGDELEFATRVGTSAFKRAFVALRPGDSVKVSRPLGGVDYDPAHPAVLVAGGIGITPVRSILLAQDAASTSAPVRLLFSNRTSDDIPFRDELSSLARERSNLTVTWVLTAPNGRVPTGPVHAGRISTDLLRQQAEELPDALFYVTGPAAMVNDVRGMLRGIAVPSGRIRAIAQGYR